MNQWRQTIFGVAWASSTVALAWLVSQGQYTFESQATFLALLFLFICTVALLRYISNPIKGNPTDAPTQKVWFVLLVTVVSILLFLARVIIGPPLLFALPIIAIIVIVWLKQPLTKREWLYASILAFIAGIAGLNAGWINFITSFEWALLQVALVLTGLLAGWSLLRHSGLSAQEVGLSRFVTGSLHSAARSFGQGIILAMPWALGNVAMGSSNSEQWVTQWWQPITALQPGIAEEAWGRILLVPLLFLLFQRVSPTRTAFTTALVVVGYWFAYLHTAGGFAALPSTLLIGTLFALPISYLCLYRDLETAIGFHFWIDLVKFAFAFVLFAN